MNKNYKSSSGFTIVELLIVVVVIAILAAITMVTYTGITDRATNLRLLSAVDAYTNAAQMYLGQTGDLPLSENQNGEWICLGNDYVAANGFAAGECLKGSIANPNGGHISATLSTIFTTTLGTLPKVGDIGTAGDGGDGLRGVQYYAAHDPFNNTTVAQIRYAMRGSQACGRGDKTLVTLASGGQVTLCVTTLQK